MPRFRTAPMSLALAITCLSACGPQHAASSSDASMPQPAVFPMSNHSSRCATSGAMCLSRDYIAQRTSWRMSDILVSAGSLTRRCHDAELPGSDACAVYMRSSAGPGSCVPAFFVNGARLRGEPENLLSDLDHHLGAATISSIEIYGSARQPAPFADISGCGSIVIWTT